MKRLILAGLSVAALSVAGISSIAAVNGHFTAQQTQNEQLQACDGNKGSGTSSGQGGQSGSTRQV